MSNNYHKQVVALIPARSGSVRVTNKNLKTLNGITLLERKILQLKGAGIHKIYVGSDSIEYLELAESRGAIPVKRDDIACDESRASANDMISDFCSRINEDAIALWAHCTNPFIYSEMYMDALKTYCDVCEWNNFDSLLSVYKVQSHMWGNDLKPLNYDPYLPTHTLAKDLVPVYFQDGGIFIQDLAKMKANSYFFGRKPYLYELDPISSYDINTEDELDVAELISGALDHKYGFDALRNIK